MRFFLFVFLVTYSLFGFSISSYDISNGRTLLISLDKEKNISYEKAVVGKKTYKIFTNPKDETKSYVLIPIDYYSKPKALHVEILYKKNKKLVEKEIVFSIEDGNYKKETIHVDSKRVKLNKKDKKRAAKEYAQAIKIYNTITPKSYINKDFIVPLDSKITSSFGKARVYNNTLKGYHSGTDFRAPDDTPIIASNDGIIVLAKDRFYSGNSVIIDHGQGIYTCYYHLNEFKVEVNQKVKRGDVLGLSGSTGRVTGPHLHFSARVGGVQVDPLQLIELLNNNL